MTNLKKATEKEMERVYCSKKQEESDCVRAADGEYLQQLCGAAPRLTELAEHLTATEEKLLRILGYLEKLRIREYLLLLERPGHLIRVNFLGGIARGLGIAIGFTVLGAFAVILLQRMAVLNLPFIGQFISELLTYIDVNTEIKIRP